MSPQSVALIDGVISYLCRVVEQGAPKARWRVGYNRIKSYMWQNHPVLAHDNEEAPLADLVPGIARAQASGRYPSIPRGFTKSEGSSGANPSPQDAVIGGVRPAGGFPNGDLEYAEDDPWFGKDANPSGRVSLPGTTA